MPVSSLSLVLSPMVGGQNGFAREAQPSQTLESENVAEDRGDLTSRPRFKSIATAPPFLLPAGRCSVLTYVTPGPTFNSDRKPVVSGSLIGGIPGGLLLVGCDVPFDGIDWKRVRQPASLTGKLWLRPQVVLSAWTAPAIPTENQFADIPWFLDTTRWIYDDENAQPLWKDGRISWHRSQIANWPLVSLNSLTRYWVALNVSATAPDFNSGTARTNTSLTGDGVTALTIQQPGIRVFELEPVTGIFPVQQHGVSRVFVMSDRPKKHGQERGAQIGSITNLQEETYIERLVADEGAGVIGQVALGSIYNSAGAGTPIGANKGTGSERLQKYNTTYNWTDYKFEGSVLQKDIVPSSPYAAGFRFAPTSPSYDTEFEHCIVEATTAGGVALNEKRRIIKSVVSSDLVILLVDPAFSATPTGSARFAIYSPAHSVTPEEETKQTASSGSHRGRRHFELDRTSAQSHIRDLLSYNWASLDDMDRSFDTDLYNRDLAWAIDQETRFQVPSAQHWDIMFDAVTGEFYLTNGSFPVMRFDNKRLRVLTATIDRNNARVQKWVGYIQDLARENNDPSLLPGAHLKDKPPAGRFITDYQGRTVVAGNPSDPFRVTWSAPGIFNDMWPKLYESLVRDPFNSPPTGMTALNNECVIWTPNSIHASPPPDESGMLSFHVRSLGVGFVSHHSVQPIVIQNSVALLGCNADGVYMYNGSEAVPVLDDWRRLVPEGINKSAIHKAVAGVSRFDNCYYLAFPSAGSELNNMIGRFNWYSQTWYPWTAPFGGITFISRLNTAGGKEIMLFGTADGHVCIFHNQEKDDSDTVTSYAKSPPLQVSGTTQAMTGLLVTMEETGANNTAAIRSYIDERGVPKQTFTSHWDQGSAIYGTARLGTATFGGRGFKTKRIPLPAGTRGEVFQYEVRSDKPFRLRSCELLLRPLAQRSK